MQLVRKLAEVFRFTTEDQTACDAPPPDQVIAHTNLYWTHERAPGRTARDYRDQGRRLQPHVLNPADAAANASGRHRARTLDLPAHARPLVNAGLRRVYSAAA